jgi:hypothetical protein
MDDRHFLALGKAIYTFQRLELADQLTIREVVPALVEVEVAVPRLTPAIW